MPATSPRPLTIVVDDDPAVRGSLAFSLDLDGFDVEAYDSAEALLSRKGPIGRDACLVLDQNLPGATGLEALKALRARHVEAPAILITSHPKAAVIAAAAAAGAPIVEKPLLGDALLREIHRVLAA
jgi:FixJ family two-component response regulator